MHTDLRQLRFAEPMWFLDAELRVIRSLRREAGTKLLAFGPHLYRAMHENKHLAQCKLILALH